MQEGKNWEEKLFARLYNMSRIGRQSLPIPTNITVEVDKNNITVKGSKGELKHTLRPEINVVKKDDQLIFDQTKITKSSSAYWGLSRALVSNMIKGVTEGYEKKLELIGVGYRVKESGDGITLSVGYSHPIEYKKPEGITFNVEENRIITIKGVDKQLVGQTAAKIRSLRKPEV